MNWFNNSNAFEKFCAVAFVFLATLSCLATAQSLCLTLGLELLPQWAIFIFAFTLAVSLYVLTAWCFKKVIDSLNNKYCAANYIDLLGRHKMFAGGLLGIIFFWLICSFPTNTHSMLYLKEAKRVAIAELENELQVFNNAKTTDDTKLHEEFRKDSLEVRSYIKEKKDHLSREVRRLDDEGFGPQAWRIVNEIEQHYKADINKIYHKDNYFEDRRREMGKDDLLRFYTQQIDNLADDIIADKQSDYLARKENLAVETAMLRNAVHFIGQTINQLKLDSVNVNEARKMIEEGYNQMAYRDQILNNVEKLKDPTKGHKPENVDHYIIYPIQRLYSVFSVWGDFFSGKLPKEFDMLYWILWAAILDIAALIFSGIAFHGKVNNNNSNQNYYGIH